MTPRISVVFVLCFSLGRSISGENVIDRIDKVLQNLLSEHNEPKVYGAESSFDVAEFLDHGTQFKDFVFEYGKMYDTDTEIEKRFGIFRDNLKEIAKFNQHELGTATYGVTHFADMTASEFKYGLAPIDWKEVERLSDSYDKFNDFNASSHNYGVEKRINYKEKGKVLEKVQDQGLCGSCWAHAAVASVESAYAIKHNKLIELSKQQVVDCDVFDSGCCGGWPFKAYDYIHYAGGIMEEKDYKQRAFEGPCKFDETKVKVNLESRYIIDTKESPELNEIKFQRFLNQIGPLVAIINAEGFRFYKSGIMNQPSLLCSKSPNSLNHAVFNIGYDSEIVAGKKYDYWIIKNSWGTKWGEQGYLRISKGTNACGIGWLATAVVTL